MKIVSFRLAMHLILVLPACQSLQENNQLEYAKFCSSRFSLDYPMKVTTLDKIEFPHIYQTIGGNVLSKCLMVELDTPVSIEIISVNEVNARENGAQFLVDGRKSSIAKIGSGEILQLKVDATPGQNIVIFRVGGRVVEWKVYVAQSTNDRNEIVEIDKSSPTYEREEPLGTEPKFDKTDSNSTPPKETDSAQNPLQEDPVEHSREPTRTLTVITVGNGDRILINPNSSPMTILEMRTTNNGEHQLVQSTR